MDGLSSAVNILSVVELAGKTLSYLAALKDSFEERHSLRIELASLRRLLETLDDFLYIEVDASWHDAVRQLEEEGGPLDRLQAALGRLEKKIRPGHKLSEIYQVLTWKLVREAARSVLSEVERVKALVQIALQIDHSCLVHALQLQVQTICSDTKAIRDAAQLQDYQALLEWLSTVHPRGVLLENLQRHHKGTGKWFLQHTLFVDWLAGSGGELLCTGDPGAGKTILASLAIEHATRLLPSENEAVVYVFCDYKQCAEQTAADLVATLLRQFIEATEEVPEEVYDLYTGCRLSGPHPSLEDWTACLELVARKFQCVHVVIDALDECDAKQRAGLLSSIRNLATHIKLKLMVTSRHVPDVLNLFQNSDKLEISAPAEDLRMYVEARTAEMTQVILSPAFVVEIKDNVANSADGIFLLARLHMDSLTSKLTLRSMKHALYSLPSASGLQRYDETYETAMNRIQDQSPERAKLAMAALQWLVSSARPMQVLELQHALAVEHGDEDFIEDGITSPDILLSVCAGLVVTYSTHADEKVFVDSLWNNQVDPRRDRQGPSVGLVHVTAQEYFDRNKNRWFPEADLTITRTCITYLSFRVFASGPRNDKRYLEAKLQEYPLLRYATLFWGKHAKAVETKQDENQQNAMLSSLVAFLNQKALVQCHIVVNRLLQHLQEEQSAETGLQNTLFFVLAKHDLAKTTKHFIDLGQYVEDDKNTLRATPLHRAMSYRSDSVIKVLLESGVANPNARNEKGRTLLHLAAYYGAEEIVKILLSSLEIDFNARDTFLEAPIYYAIMAGQNCIVELLLQCPSIDLISIDARKRTPLQFALEYGQLDAATLLSQSGKLGELEAAAATACIARLSSVQVDRDRLLRILTKASRFEATWRDSRGWVALSYAMSKSGIGTCWFLIEQLRRGTVSRFSKHHNSVILARCREYIGEAGDEPEQSSLMAQAWFYGFLSNIEPWFLRSREIFECVDAHQFSRIVNFRLHDTPCDQCHVAITNGALHCEVCDNDNFDICFKCVEQGYWCHDKQHAMWQYDSKREEATAGPWRTYEKRRIRRDSVMTV